MVLKLSARRAVQTLNEFLPLCTSLRTPDYRVCVEARVGNCAMSCRFQGGIRCKRSTNFSLSVHPSGLGNSRVRRSSCRQLRQELPISRGHVVQMLNEFLPHYASLRTRKFAREAHLGCRFSSGHFSNGTAKFASISTTNFCCKRRTCCKNNYIVTRSKLNALGCNTSALTLLRPQVHG